MRALLAAIPCHDEDIATNLAAHLIALDDARRARCDVAIFPELSLSGTGEALRSPGRAISLDHPAVGVVDDTTRHADFTAVFGIAERSGDALFLTQVVAHDGAMTEVHRTVMPGADDHRSESAMGSPSGRVTGSRSASAIVTAPRVIAVAGRRLGVVGSAGSTIDDTWDALAAAGADVIAMCSPPGPYGEPEATAASAGLELERDTAVDRSTAREWWESAGLVDACRHARRLGVWVVIATPAGSTFHDDVPAIAALVAPDGRVVDRRPDWLPGTLVVEIPRRGD